MADYSSPAGIIPKLLAATHRWRSRGGLPPADEGSLPLGRVPTRGERLENAMTQQEIDREGTISPMDLISGLGPAKAMFLGAMARNAPQARISKAMQMASAGKDKEEIYKATTAAGGGLPGIHFGKEGLPRWEISDKSAYLQPLAEKFMNENPKAQTAYYLKDLLEHPRLFGEYPQLKDSIVKIDPTTDVSSFSPSDFSMILGTYGKPASRNKVYSLLHEIQHAIQEIEGFAKGANPSFMYEKAQERLTELGQRMTMLDKAFLSREGMPQYISDLSPSQLDKFKRMMKTPSYEKLQQEWMNLAGNIENPREIVRLYARLAGEAEARNTSMRQFLDYPTRSSKDFRPWETQDIPDSLQTLFM